MTVIVRDHWENGKMDYRAKLYQCDCNGRAGSGFDSDLYSTA